VNDSFVWDDRNVEHIARHRVEPEEVEEVFTEQPLIRRARDGRYLALGRTEAGRLLAVVFVRLPAGRQLRVITARDMNSAERDDYRRRGK
jgi:uncharacterized DUF497 family protein